MPSDIKKTAIVLIISCISSLIAVYFDGLEFEEIGYGDPFIVGINVVWAFIITWIVWDLFRGKDIRLTLVLVGAIMLASLAWDLTKFGFGIAQVFYTIELLMFITAYLLLKSDESKVWYSAKSI